MTGLGRLSMMNEGLKSDTRMSNPIDRKVGFATTKVMSFPSSSSLSFSLSLFVQVFFKIQQLCHSTGNRRIFVGSVWEALVTFSSCSVFFIQQQPALTRQALGGCHSWPISSQGGKKQAVHQPLPHSGGHGGGEVQNNCRTSAYEGAWGKI